MNQLIPIRVNEDSDAGHYRYDCQRMVQVMAQHGYYATEEQVRRMWDKYSDSMAAGWLHLPEDDEQLFMDLSYHFEPEQGIVMRSDG